MSPTGSAAALLSVLAIRAAGFTDPVVFGAAVFGAAVLGSAPALFGCTLGHAVGGARGNRTCDAGPGFAAAEEAQHAALNLHMVGIDRLDRRTVVLPVLGVIDLAFPFIDAGLLLHVDQDRHARGSACSVLRHRDCARRGRPASFPRPPRPTCCRCTVQPGYWRRRRPPSSRRWDRAPSAGARPVAKNIPEYTTVRMIFRGQCNMV